MTDQVYHELQNGQTVGGYLLVQCIGSGSMGSIWQAVQRSMDRIVALKILSPELAEDGDFVRRFLRESQVAASFSSSFVIAVHDAGIDGDLLYIAMELADGGDMLQHVRQQGGSLAATEVALIMHQCAAGLDAIHKAGLIHRDIKPANVFRMMDGQIKLGDLGLARNKQDDGHISQVGLVVGTPAYMSPEQYRAEADLDIRTDIFSLGATCFRLLTGEDPFPGSDLRSILDKVSGRRTAIIDLPEHAQVSEDALAEAHRTAALYGELEEIIFTCMRRERDERYANPEQLLAVLRPLVDGVEGLPGAGQAGKSVAASEPETKTVSPPMPTSSGRQKRRSSRPRRKRGLVQRSAGTSWALVIVAIVGVVLVVMALALSYQQR